jgi:multimeric flavodoxin WrbA
VIILGISASSRQWGNTDLLVHHVLAGARREGAETSVVRLADLELAPCTGCMRCVFGNRDCVIDDGYHEVLRAMRGADAIVLGSPTYLLGAATLVKLLHERLLRFATSAREFVGRPGVAVTAAGRPGYEPFALPQIATVFLSLGMPVVDQFVGYGQGPGEVLGDEAALARATGAGAALARGDVAFRGDPGACPSCHFDLVTLMADGRGRCPLCDLPGTWELGVAGARTPAALGAASAPAAPHFVADPDAQSRWAEDRVRGHLQESLLPSRDRFREHRHEIRARVDALRAEFLKNSPSEESP